MGTGLEKEMDVKHLAPLSSLVPPTTFTYVHLLQVSFSGACDSVGYSLGGG